MAQITALAAALTVTVSDPPLQWELDHRAAIEKPFDLEEPLVGMLWSLIRYREAHERVYRAPLSDDVLLGEAWLCAVQAWVTLLAGDTGRLDAQTLIGIAEDMVEGAGFPRPSY